MVPQYDEGIGFTLPTPEKEGYSSSWTVLEPEDGYVLDGLKLTVPSTPCTLVVKATYIGRTYTLGFEGVDTVLDVTYGEAINRDLPVVPTRDGYKNGKWVIDGKTITKDYIWDFADNKVAVAEYELDSYVVTFVTNGGSIVEEITVSYGSTITKPNDPTKENYSFGGWYLDEGLTNLFDFDTPITSNITSSQTNEEYSLNNFFISSISKCGFLHDIIRSKLSSKEIKESLLI